MSLFSALNPFTFSRKQKAAWNALMAAYTFDTLAPDKKKQVMDKALEIESSARRRPVTLLELTARTPEAARYVLFSLAMMNCGIRPALGTELWFGAFGVNNPHTDLINATEILASTKHQLEKQFSVSFPSLSNEP